MVMPHSVSISLSKTLPMLPNLSFRSPKTIKNFCEPRMKLEPKSNFPFLEDIFLKQMLS
jgi:hypothetical protein